MWIEPTIGQTRSGAGAVRVRCHHARAGIGRVVNTGEFRSGGNIWRARAKRKINKAERSEALVIPFVHRVEYNQIPDIITELSVWPVQ